MKRTEENIATLLKLGFTCDWDRTKDDRDWDWFSLKCGWGFRLDAHKNFPALMKAMIEYNKDDL